MNHSLRIKPTLMDEDYCSSKLGIIHKICSNWTGEGQVPHLLGWAPWPWPHSASHLFWWLPEPSRWFFFIRGFDILFLSMQSWHMGLFGLFSDNPLQFTKTRENLSDKTLVLRWWMFCALFPSSCWYKCDAIYRQQLFTLSSHIRTFQWVLHHAPLEEVLLRWFWNSKFWIYYKDVDHIDKYYLA